MRTKLIVLFAALTLAVSAGTSSALAQTGGSSGDDVPVEQISLNAGPGLTTAATAASGTPETSSFSWGISKASPKLL